jgi:hypothetical protein
MLRLQRVMMQIITTTRLSFHRSFRSLKMRVQLVVVVLCHHHIPKIGLPDFSLRFKPEALPAFTVAACCAELCRAPVGAIESWLRSYPPLP